MKKAVYITPLGTFSSRDTAANKMGVTTRTINNWTTVPSKSISKPSHQLLHALKKVNPEIKEVDVVGKTFKEIGIYSERGNDAYYSFLRTRKDMSARDMVRVDMSSDPLGRLLDFVSNYFSRIFA